jgi:hypothetical protein
MNFLPGRVLGTGRLQARRDVFADMLERYHALRALD